MFVEEASKAKAIRFLQGIKSMGGDCVVLRVVLVDGL
jgi:hypothetical protein